MIRKLIHIRPRHQITLPQELVDLWNVGPGDYLRVRIADDGMVSLLPARIAVEGSPDAAAQNRQAEEDIAAGRYRTFEDMDSFERSLKEEPVQAATAKVHTAVDQAIVEDIERAYIRAALRAANWNKRAAAKRVVEGFKKFRFESDSERVK